MASLICCNAVCFPVLKLTSSGASSSSDNPVSELSESKDIYHVNKTMSNYSRHLTFRNSQLSDKGIQPNHKFLGFFLDTFNFVLNIMK